MVVFILLLFILSLQSSLHNILLLLDIKFAQIQNKNIIITNSDAGKK